jgi:hypothetical protein
MTATFAPTKRNGRFPTKKRPLRCHTNWPEPGLVVEFGEAIKNRTAALEISTSAATGISFLIIKASKLRNLSRARHPDKTHNRTDGAHDYKQVKERSDAQGHRQIHGVLIHAQKNKHAKEQKV